MDFLKLLMVSDRQFIRRSLLIVCTICSIAFLSNWLMALNSGESYSPYKLFEISFFYFIPIMSWWLAIVLLVGKLPLAFKHQKKWVCLGVLLPGLVLLAFIMRVVDILLDFSIKYLVGMVSVSPFEVLNDVWLVVIATTPGNVALLLIFMVVVYFRMNNMEQPKERLKVSRGKASLYIPLKDIVFIKANGNYLLVHDEKDQYKLRSSLGGLSDELTDEFLQVHRSVIINKPKVKSIEHWRNGEYLITMINGQNVASSRSYSGVLQALKQSAQY